MAARDSSEVAVRLARADGEQREQRATEIPRAAPHDVEHNTIHNII